MPNKQADFRDAHYQCVSCNHQWIESPRAVVCPKCKHLYAKWANYEECSKAYHALEHISLEQNAFGGPLK